MTTKRSRADGHEESANKKPCLSVSAPGTGVKISDYLQDAVLLKHKHRELYIRLEEKKRDIAASEQLAERHARASR